MDQSTWERMQKRFKSPREKETQRIKDLFLNVLDNTDGASGAVGENRIYKAVLIVEPGHVAGRAGDIREALLFKVLGDPLRRFAHQINARQPQREPSSWNCGLHGPVQLSISAQESGIGSWRFVTIAMKSRYC